VIPVERPAFASPIAVTKSTVGKKGHSSCPLQQRCNMLKHCFTHVKRDKPFGRDHVPGQWQRAIAVRKAEAQHLQAVAIYKTAIEHNRDLAVSPLLKDVLNNRLIQCLRVDMWVLEPAPDFGNACSCLSRIGNMIGN